MLSIFSRLRHNLITYMFFDVPINKYVEEKKISRSKNLLGIRYVLVIGFFFWINTFHNINSAPAYNELILTNGVLEGVHRKSGRGGSAKRISIVDEKGKTHVFPSPVGNLFLTTKQIYELEKSCIGEEITIRWAEEPMIFWGSVRDIWELKSCSDIAEIDFKRKSDIRSSSIDSNLKFLWLLVFFQLLLVFPFFLNYRKASYLLKQKMLEKSIGNK